MPQTAARDPGRQHQYSEKKVKTFCDVEKNQGKTKESEKTQSGHTDVFHD